MYKKFPKITTVSIQWNLSKLKLIKSSKEQLCNKNYSEKKIVTIRNFRNEKEILQNPKKYNY